MSVDLLKKNIGGKDREARLIGGAILSAVGCLTKNRLIKTAGCTMLVTGIMQRCIFYDFLDINTYDDKQNLT